MSSSARLRKTQTRDGGGRSMFNANAKQHEKNLQDSVLKIKSELESMYPELKFTYRKKLYLSEIVEKLGKTFTPESKKPYVDPDGGLLFIEWNGTEYPVLISEAKKQGSNDARLKKGLKKQSRANAIERAYKNALAFSQYNEKLDYNPYVIFACGCDFDKDSSIIDRLWHLTRFEPMNTNLSLFNEDVTSVYLKGHHYTEEPNFWTVSEIYEIMKEITVGIINHVTGK